MGTFSNLQKATQKWRKQDLALGQSSYEDHTLNYYPDASSQRTVTDDDIQNYAQTQGKNKFLTTLSALAVWTPATKKKKCIKSHSFLKCLYNTSI